MAMKRNNFLGLPAFGLNVVCMSLAVFLVCLGIKALRSSNLALRIANSQLVVGNNANRLERLAKQLEQQAELIEQKDEAYKFLLDAYETSRAMGNSDENLDVAIEVIEELPKVEGIDKIQSEIQETEVELSEVIDKEGR